MCWLMKTCSPTASATEFFRCAPTARTILHFGFRILNFALMGKRRVAAGAAQNHFAIQHHAHNRVVHVADDGAVVNEKHIGNAAQPLQRLEFVRADRFVAQVAAGGDDGETEFGHQQMMQRI